MNRRQVYLVLLMIAVCWLGLSAGNTAAQQRQGNRGPQGAPPPPPPNGPPNGPPGGPRREGQDPNRMLFALLDLSDDQKKQIEEIREHEREAARPLHDQLHDAQEQLHNATANGAFDEVIVRQLAGKVAQIETELTVLRLKTGADIFNTLTPEQKMKLKQLHESLKERRDERQPPPQAH